VTRIEQFHPFPFVSVKNNIESYPNLESIVWAQEEHLNAGGWTFVQPRLQTLLKETKFSGMEVTYAGRGPSARSVFLISFLLLVEFADEQRCDWEQVST